MEVGTDVISVGETSEGTTPVGDANEATAVFVETIADVESGVITTGGGEHSTKTRQNKMPQNDFMKLILTNLISERAS